MIPALVTMSCPSAYAPDGPIVVPDDSLPPLPRLTMLARAAALSLVALIASVAMAQDVDPNARIIASLELPHAANEARRAGVGDDQIGIVLGMGKEKKAEAGDVAGALRAGAEGVKDNGPIDNFGAFVQAQLDAGLRGQELAAAIKAEHAAHGKGKGQGGPPPGKGVGAPDGAGRPEGVKGQGAGKAPPEMGKGAPGAGKGKPPAGKGPEGKGGGQPGAGKAPPKGDGNAPEASKGGGRK